MRKIRVAHFGIAHDHSRFAMQMLRRYPEVFEIVGVCEPDEAARRVFGGIEEYEGLPWLTEQELLSREDIDAAVCEGFELRSVQDAQKCLDRGLHVHLDKPGGTDLAAFKRLLDTAREKQLVFQMGYMYRWNPAMKYVRSAVRAGKLGTITGIDATFSVQYDEKKKNWLRQFPGGMMFFLGCHSLDMIYQLLGEPLSAQVWNRSSGYEDGGALDSCLAILDYPHGAATIRTSGVEPNGYADRMLKVVGTKAAVKIQPLETPTVMRVSWAKDGREDPYFDYSTGVFPGFLRGRYDEMFLDFAAMTRGEIENEWTAEYEYGLQKLLLELCR